MKWKRNERGSEIGYERGNEIGCKRSKTGTMRGGERGNRGEGTRVGAWEGGRENGDLLTLAIMFQSLKHDSISPIG